MKNKRKIIIIAAAVLAAAGLVSAFAIKSHTAEKQRQQKNIIKFSEAGIDAKREDMFFIAHRGFSAIAPENTVPAAEKAYWEAFNAVEFDIRETKDGVLVVMHNEKIDQMTNARGKISEMTYKELLECTIDSGANISEYTNLKIPTFEEFFDRCLEMSVMPVIEIKSISDEGLKKLEAYISERQLDSECAIISFHYEFLEKLQAINGKLELWLLAHKLDDETLKQSRSLGNIRVSFNANEKYNSDEQISRFANEKIPLAAWVVDDLEQLSALYKNHSINYITTNCISPIK